jgi:exodeoxyribonuclease V beta subunit
VALTSFVGETPPSLDRGGDDLTDAIAEQVRGWLDLFRARGIAAVHESIRAGGLAERVLARPDGERLLTDLHHLGQVLHDVAHRERLGLPALLEWLRRERREASTSTERTRRLDSDAAAVQFVTVHGSKGLQYPVVYLPMLFNRWVPDEKTPLFHDGSRRMLDVGGDPDREVRRQAAAEDAAEELRLTYVALTRAQSQVVCWWAPSWNAETSGLSRLLFGRQPGQPAVPDKVDQGPSDDDIAATLEGWQAAGALHLEVVEADPASVVAEQPDDAAIAIRTFGRELDTTWRRTSYSGLIRAEEQIVTAVVDVEPEEPGTVDEDPPDDDEVPDLLGPADEVGESLLSPMNDLPAGATFGSLVHGVLEHADPEAADLRAELREHVAEQLRWWPVDASPDDLAAALLPMQVTSLGPLADGLRLADIPASDRLCELDFEFPLVGGDRPSSRVRDTELREVAAVLRRHLPGDDPMRAYADRLETPSLGDQQLRGYLSGSIDVVLRVPDGADDHRYLVVDYKTNKLGSPDQPLTALDYTQPLMSDAMLHSHYPLQALLYSVVLHRYLRWRQPGYDPERHLGGILYLYVRGMCGADTPEVDGVPCGVFTWKPPAAMIVELSELLAGQEVAA